MRCLLEKAVFSLKEFFVYNNITYLEKDQFKTGDKQQS